MDNETKLKVEQWQIKLDDKIKYMLSLDKNYTYILTKKSFYIYEKNKDLLTKHLIPQNEEKDILGPDESQIWSDRIGNHIIFKLDGITYYYNDILPNDKKIKILNLEYNKQYIEPFTFALNNNNQFKKTTDEIIFTDIDSSIYTLVINVDNLGEIQIKINKVYDFKITYIDKNIEKIIDKNEKEKEEKLNALLDDNYFKIDNDDRIHDIKLYIHEEKKGEGKKMIINRSYFILAVSKRIIFQFSGKNSIQEVFSSYKTEDNKIDKDKLYKDCKIFPKVNKIDLKKTKIQFISPKDKKPHFYWNNECGFCTWPLVGSPLPLPQKEFNLYNYIKLKNDGTYEVKPIPIMCCETQKCIYFLYSKCLVIFNTLTENIILTKYLKEEYLDIYYNKEMDKLIIYSNNKILKISLDHERNDLWKDYIERGEYDLALQYFPFDDEEYKAKLRKLNGDLLFKRKEYDLSAVEYSQSDENFEHICLKLLKLNNNNPLINYLSYVNKIKLSTNQNKDDNKYFIQKYLINTWILELLLEKEDINKQKESEQKGSKQKDINQKNIKQKDIKTILYKSDIIESPKYIDKLAIYRVLRSYGRYEDFLNFAGIKNDYKTIIFDLVNHNKYKEALNNLLLYMSYVSPEDENYLQDLQSLIKIFFNYINIFIKESPKEGIKLIDQYYYLIENPIDIIRIINNINIYDNNIYEENYENILNLIKKLINVTKKSNRNIKDKLNDAFYDLSFKQNLYNLYILYLSISKKLEHYNELLDFLKSLVNNLIIKNNYYNINNIDTQIYFEFTFAQNTFKKSKSCLALIYCLKKEYNKSISFSLSNEDKETSIFIANTISDPKKKKEIWLEIFNHFKSTNINIIKDILNKSDGVLKILDILPHLMGNIQVKKIKNDLKNCINQYEQKLKKLKLNIKDYGVSVDVLSQKVNKINKGEKFLKISFKEIECAICFRDLKELNFYLFPCRHAFDFDCLINTLFYYDSQNIGDEMFKRKILGIKQLINEIKRLNLRKKNIFERKTSIAQNQKKQNAVTEFFRNLTLKNTNNTPNTANIDFSTEEENQLKDLENVLDELLSQECPLCGNEMILSTQKKFGDEDNNDWKL